MAAPTNTITVTDNRTGETFELPVDEDGMVDALAFKKKTCANESVPPLMLFDPGYRNTACCDSAITYIDGDKGILRYRGYNIEELAEKSTFLEVAFLLIYGELPSTVQYEYFYERVMKHTFIHEDLTEMMKGFRFNAHPMGIMVATVASMSTFHPEGNPALRGPDTYASSKDLRNKQIFRILGKMPTIAAAAYRHRIGRPYNYPADSAQELTYTGNFLYMLDRLSELEYKPNPLLARALDVLFILHADHELNCSTATMRQLSSTRVDVYSCVSGAIGALYGPLHGGANAAVLKMLADIGTVDAVPDFVSRVKSRETKLMGFGHRVYKNYDPRANILKSIAGDIFELLGTNPLMEVAVELERVALSDEYFVSRKLYPNVDFYSGLIYQAMGFPVDYFPVLFAIPRTAGWIAHWNESFETEHQQIYRPRQKYTGYGERAYVELENREVEKIDTTVLQAYVSGQSRRRESSVIAQSTPRPGSGFVLSANSHAFPTQSDDNKAE